MGLGIVVLFVLLGGYTTIAWVDLFQGMFLLAVIVLIPTLLFMQVGSLAPIAAAVQSKSSHLSLWSCLSLSVGWGIGYFGQPHIITKFMGIRDVQEIRKSRIVGLVWQVTVLLAATCIGIAGIYFFPQGLENPQTLTLELVKASLFPSIAGLVFCAIVAATVNVMSAQILITASNISEDLCKKFSWGSSLGLSRISVLIVGLIAYIIAYFKISTVYDLVQYAWTGLGASFGPLVMTALYARSVNRYGAYAGLVVGSLVAAFWDSFCGSLNISSMIPAFLCNLGAQFAVSYVTRKRFVLQRAPE